MCVCVLCAFISFSFVVVVPQDRIQGMLTAEKQRELELERQRREKLRLERLKREEEQRRARERRRREQERDMYRHMRDMNCQIELEEECCDESASFSYMPESRSAKMANDFDDSSAASMASSDDESASASDASSDEDSNDDDDDDDDDNDDDEEETGSQNSDDEKLPEIDDDTETKEEDATFATFNKAKVVDYTKIPHQLNAQFDERDVSTKGAENRSLDRQLSSFSRMHDDCRLRMSGVC